jgi:hypothetical protein
MDQSGALLGDRLILGTVRIMAAPLLAQPLAEQPLARWQNGIHLIASEIDQDEAGTPSVIRLQWQATANGVTEYTVFVQLLNANNAVLAQRDQQPQGGKAPTSTWRRGEIIADVYVLDPPAQPWQRLIIGLYDQGGERLLRADPGGPSDYFILIERES